MCAFVCACVCMCKREKERERERERLRAYALTTGVVYTLMTNRLIVTNCHELSRIVTNCHELSYVYTQSQSSPISSIV